MYMNQYMTLLMEIKQTVKSDLAGSETTLTSLNSILVIINFNGPMFGALKTLFLEDSPLFLIFFIIVKLF